MSIRIVALEVNLKSAKEALFLQAREYERRLGELNHAHERQIERNADYVSREVWEVRMQGHETKDDQKHREIDEWRREIDRWRWIAVGMAMAAGGASGSLAAILIHR